MGDPRRLRKKYSSPGHPFEKERIDKEREIVQTYGLKNKREIWKAESQIRKYRTIARSLQGMDEEKRKTKEEELMKKLIVIGIVNENATLDDVLGLTVTDLLERRLQTLIFKKGLSKTIKQARQLIVHGHISVNGRMVNVPGYIVKVDEEEKIGYYGKPVELGTETKEEEKEELEGDIAT